MAKKSAPLMASVAMPTAVQKLDMLPDIKSGIGIVLQAVFEADVAFLAAETDEAKVEARVAVTKAKADFRKMVGDLNALVNGGALSGDERTFEAAHSIEHNGIAYAAGEPIPLNHAAFVGLKEVGAVVGDWPE
jgi:hypothetical protein